MIEKMNIQDTDKQTQWGSPIQEQWVGDYRVTPVNSNDKLRDLNYVSSNLFYSIEINELDCISQKCFVFIISGKKYRHIAVAVFEKIDIGWSLSRYETIWGSLDVIDECHDLEEETRVENIRKHTEVQHVANEIERLMNLSEG